MASYRGRRRAEALLAALFVLPAMAGCGDGSPRDPGSPAGLRSASTPHHVIHTQRNKRYTSFRELRVDSVAVVRIRATAASHIVEIGSIPFTVTVVETLEVLDGDFSETTFPLRQLGGGTDQIEDYIPLVVAGREYVVFLYKEAFPSESPTVQYWPAGETGLYSLEAGMLEHVDPSVSLPRSLTVEELVEQINS